MIDVPVNNEHGYPVSEAVLADVVRRICRDHGVCRGEVSLAIVDDSTMHWLNREHLRHDYATDVLSFLLEREGDALEGEVIVSADTANNVAGEYAWSERDELLLYVVHGTLHLVGYDDGDHEARGNMRDREIYYLRAVGVEPPVRHAARDLMTGQGKETSV